MSWQEKHEIRITGILDQCRDEAKKLRVWARRLGYINNGMKIVSSIVSFGTPTALSFEKVGINLVYIVYLCGIINIVMHYAAFVPRIISNLNAAKRYDDLVGEIMSELTKPREDRILAPDTYIMIISTKFREIKSDLLEEDLKRIQDEQFIRRNTARV